MRSVFRTAAGLAALTILVAGCNGGSSGQPGANPTRTPLTAPTSSGPAQPAGGDARHYTGNGTNIARLQFDSDGTTVAGMSGVVRLACATLAGSSDGLLTLTDPDQISVDGDRAFTDEYTISGAPGATVDVSGVLDGQGAATGYLQFHEPGCATPLDPWSASIAGRPQPPIASFSPSQEACSPQPCAALAGVTLAVQGVHGVSNSAGPGIAVAFTVANGTDHDASVSSSDFYLQSASGDKVMGSYSQFADGSGQPVPCLASTSVQIAAGQSASDEDVCFAVSADHAGGPFTLIWFKAGAGTTSVDIGSPE